MAKTQSNVVVLVVEPNYQPKVLPSIHRLNLRLNRNRVSSEGHTIHSPNFTIVISPSGQLDSPYPPTRFAVLLSKKISKLAVVRNHLKRLVSESIANNLTLFPLSSDILIIPKKSALSLALSDINTEFKHTFNARSS